MRIKAAFETLRDQDFRDFPRVTLTQPLLLPDFGFEVRWAPCHAKDYGRDLPVRRVEC